MALQLYKIAAVEVGSAGASSMAFSSIPQGYTDLKLVITSRDTNTSANNGNIKIAFNGSATSYTNRWIRASGAAASSATGATTYIEGALGAATDSAGNTANTFANVEIYIPNYAGSTNKSISIDMVSEDNSATAYSGFSAGLWSNTSAITTIAITPTTAFAQYGTATLYGIL
jgi:hypothetical protein